VRPSTSFPYVAASFLSSITRRNPIGHRPIRKEKGIVGRW
jgi:hypothetical protein